MASSRFENTVYFALGVLLLSLTLSCRAQTEDTGIRMLDAQTAWPEVPAEWPATEGHVDVGGARLWYWDTGGDGEPVVLVHPYSGSALTWKYQQATFAQAGYRVIAYSRRGHYRSDIGDADNPGTGVEDLFQLMEHLELVKIHLVGIAAGADIVPDFAISYPERLHSLVIGSTIGRPGDPAYRESDSTLLPPEFRRLPAWLKELSPAYRAGNPEGTLQWKALEEQSKVKRVPVPPRNQVTPEAIAEINAPVLLFTGDADLYMPPSRLRAYASYWRDPEVAVFREAGHAPYWEQPDVFNRLLLDFFGRHSSRSPGFDVRQAAITTPEERQEPRAFGDRDIDITWLPAQTQWQPLPAQAPVTEGYVDIEGARLWYWDTGGDGIPVVLLHPYTGSALIWGYQQPELVAAGYRVIAYSRRGHYRSDTGAVEKLVPSANDLNAVVNHLQLGRFHLVGSAAGGFIVPDYAISHPDRLLSITIATSTGGARDPVYRNVFESMIRTPEVVELPHWLKELGPSYRDANPEGTQAWIAMEHDSVHTILRPPAKNTLQWNEFESIDLPVLLIGADGDMYMPPAMLRELAARLPDPEVYMLSESGHSGYWEQPIAFNRTLIDFLQRQDSVR